MFRYLIAAGNPDDGSFRNTVTHIKSRLAALPDRWQCPLDKPDVFVSYVSLDQSPESAYRLGKDRGAILGTLFKTPGHFTVGPPRRIAAISDADSQDIIASRGRSLAGRYWGAYVAVIRRPGCVTVTRAPVSSLPCFRLVCGSMNIFFSHVSDCSMLDLKQLTVNWDSITAQVVGGDYFNGETGITEIEALECGDAVEITAENCSRHSFWDPRSILAADRIGAFCEATQMTREVVEYSADALASSHSNILIELSGGLDSSIVLSSLARTQPRPTLTAVNYYSRGLGDERHFAREMAARAGCRLIEQPRDEYLDLRRLLRCNWTVRPVLNFSAPDTEARNIAIARQVGASAIFDGELGDNVFGSNPTPGAVVETYRATGAGRRAVSTAADYAFLSRQSIWRVLKLAYREHRILGTDPDFTATREMTRFVSADAANSQLLASLDAHAIFHAMRRRYIHPWFKNAAAIAPGSHALLFGLIATTSPTYNSPFSKPTDPSRVSPLLAQPVVELALRTAPHLHFRNGTDRAVARAAFTELLPKSIIRRGLGKGGPTLWAADVVEHNIDFLRELLMDGILAKRGLIDRRKVDAVLSHRIQKTTVIVGDIFAKAYIEAWLQNFPTNSMSHAAHVLPTRV
jgi:asparagine synthase (glutamine-hydrolysing)